MCGLEQQHHFLWLMSLTSHPVPCTGSQSKRDVNAITHPSEGKRDSAGKLASGISEATVTVALYVPITSCLHVSSSLQHFPVTSFSVYISGKTYTEIWQHRQ